MKRYENEKHVEIQCGINEQEQAMSDLLLRVMARPLVPLQTALDALENQLIAVQQANTNGTRSVEAQLSALENESKRLQKRFDELDDEVAGLKSQLSGLASALDKHQIGQTGRDGQIQDGLARAASKLAELDAKADAASATLAATVRGHGSINDADGKISEQQQASAARLNSELNGLAEQQGGQQAKLCTRMDTLQSSLAQHFDTQAAAIGGSAKEITRHYELLSETNKDWMAATIQEQLVLRLAPFQTRTKWLAALCGLSFGTTLALLGLQVFH